MTQSTARQVRLEEANALIKLIASHGRHFFWYRGQRVYNEKDQSLTWRPADRTARFELRKGRLYYIDEYTEKAIYLQRTGIESNWDGFSHGGTLRGLVESMRDYILNGTRVPGWQIVIQQQGREDLEKNIWGYDAAAAQFVRDAAYKMPMVAV